MSGDVELNWQMPNKSIELPHYCFSSDAVATLCFINPSTCRYYEFEAQHKKRNEAQYSHNAECRFSFGAEFLSDAAYRCLQVASALMKCFEYYP